MGYRASPNPLAQAISPFSIALPSRPHLPTPHHPPLQVIVFSFSKLDVERRADEMQALDLTDAAEKTLIESIFGNAKQCLSLEDQKLPQIGKVGGSGVWVGGSVRVWGFTAVRGGKPCPLTSTRRQFD